MILTIEALSVLFAESTAPVISMFSPTAKSVSVAACFEFPMNFSITVAEVVFTVSVALALVVRLKLAPLTAAIVPVIGLGYTFTVQGPSCITANVGFTLTAAPGYVKGNLLAPAETAVTAFINALPMGAALPWSRLAQVVYDSTPGVGNVTGMLANAGTADLGGGTAQVVRAGTVTAS